jgi:hypothetical protein
VVFALRFFAPVLSRAVDEPLPGHAVPSKRSVRTYSQANATRPERLKTGA